MDVDADADAVVVMHSHSACDLIFNQQSPFRM